MQPHLHAWVVEYNPIFAALIVEAAARERAKLGCYRPAGGDGVYCVRRQNAKPGVVVDVLRGVRGGDGAGVSAVACRGSHEIAVSSACRATGRQRATRENCASQAVRSPGAINVDGPSAALPLIDAIAASGDLDGYHLLHSARADLLRRMGSNQDSAKAYLQALDLVTNDSERRFLERRLHEVSGQA